MISCAQASLDNYVGIPATGKDELRQRCFLHHVLRDAINRNYGERVVQELEDDLKEVESYLSKKNREGSSDARSCYTTAFECSRINANTSSARKRIASIDVYDKICHRWYKFGHLCQKIKARNSGDRLVMATEEWICKVAAENKLQFNSYPEVQRGYETCPDQYGN